MFFLLIFLQDRLMILFQWNLQLLCFCQSPRLFQLPCLLPLEIFCQPPHLLHLPRLLFWPESASLLLYSALPFYLKLKSTWILTALLFILKLKIFIKTLLMTLKWFDTSNYIKDDNRPLPIGWKIMKEFVGLRAKTWAYLLDDDSEHKEKRKKQKYA